MILFDVFWESLRTSSVGDFTSSNKGLNESRGFFVVLKRILGESELIK